MVAGVVFSLLDYAILAAVLSRGSVLVAVGTVPIVRAVAAKILR